MKTRRASITGIALLLMLAHFGAAPAQRPNTEMTGIGVMLGKAPNGVLLEAVLPGSPAEKAGLRANEVVLVIDGSAVTGVEDAMKRLTGAEGTAVALLVVGPDGRTRTVNITRARIALGSRGPADFVGSFAFQQSPEKRVDISVSGADRYRIECKAEHWTGLGILYENKALVSVHLKGVYQIDSSGDVPENQRGLVGYFRIDCTASGLLTMKRAWNLAGDPGDQSTSVMLLRIKAEPAAAPNAAAPGR